MYDPEFDRPSVKAGPRSKSSMRLPPPPIPNTQTVDPLDGEKLTRKERRARLQNVERDNVLAGINRALPKKLSVRQVALKQLVVDKILLKTGAINYAHPVVAAWVRSKRKNSKKNA
jgi:hypothetical protein